MPSATADPLAPASAASSSAPLAGLTLARLGEAPGEAHAAARDFCLAVIKEYYGFDHRPDWHGDLDALLRPAAENPYSAANRGGFWTLAEPDGGIVATAGLRGLASRPDLLAQFADRYQAGERVASLWRVYVRRDRRGRGLGRWFNALVEDAARGLGYTSIYLHASTDAAATIAFWRASGYVAIGDHGFSTHFDKALVSAGCPAGGSTSRPAA